MSVSDGQPVNAAVTNAAFMSRTTDTSTVGKVELNNTIDPNSGIIINNLQQLVNEIIESLGFGREGDVNNNLTFSNTNVLQDLLDFKANLERIDREFDNDDTIGHTHNGNDSAKVSALDLNDINLLIAQYEADEITGVTGSTATFTALAGKQANGDSINDGVITSAPDNRCEIRLLSTGEILEDGNGNKVYARVTFTGDFELDFFVNDNGVETSYSFASATDLNVFYREVFRIDQRPTIPADIGSIGSINLTADIEDASDTQRGVINLVSQDFAGVKNFIDGLQVGGVGVVDLTSSQTLTNKTISGGTIENASIENASIETPVRLDAKKDTEANLTTYASTATDGEVLFATDTEKYYGVVSGSLVTLGGEVDLNSAQTLTNKTLSTGTEIINVSEIEVKKDTEANLVTYATTAPDGRLAFSTDTKKYFITTDNLLVEVGSGGSGQGRITYLEGTFDEDISEWAGNETDPLKFVAVHETTEPLRGDGSLKLDKLTGQDATDEEIKSIQFTIARGDQTSLLSVRMGNIFTSSNYVDEYIEVALRSVESGKLIRSANGFIPAGSYFPREVVFQTEAFGGGLNEGVYEVVFICRTNDTNQFDVIIDDFSFGPITTLVGSGAMTDMQDWNPVFTGLGSGTVSVEFAKFHQEGQFAIIQLNAVWTANGSGATPVLLDISDIGSLDNDSYDSSAAIQYTMSGGSFRNENQSAPQERNSVHLRHVESDSDNTFRIMSTAGGGNNLSATTDIDGGDCSQFDRLDIWLKVPIKGWTSGVKTVGQLGEPVVSQSFYARGASSTSIPNSGGSGTVIFGNQEVEQDTLAYDELTGVYTAQKSGWLEFHSDFSVNLTSPGEGNFLQARLNQSGSKNRTIGRAFFEYQDGGSNLNADFNLSGRAYFQKGDTASVELINNTNQSVTVGSSTAHFSGGDIGKDSRFFNPDTTVSLIASMSAAQSITNSTTTLLLLDAATEDTHGMFNSASSTAEIKIPGLYHVVAASLWDNSSGGGTRFIEVEVDRGSGFVREAEGTLAPGNANCTTYADKKIRLDFGDILRVRVFQTSGGTLTVFNPSRATYFELTRIGN